jgi:hypothetical protein
MKWLLIIVVATVYAAYHYSGNFNNDNNVPTQSTLEATTQQEATTGADLISQAFESKARHLQVEASGEVIKLLPDDNKGSRHQRFIVRLDNGMTLLIVHNIDLAPKVADIKVGDAVSFYGEYEFNQKGGLVHWTHHDPAGRHVAGWLKYKGRTYQ